MGRARPWTSRLAPWAAVIGVLSGGIQLLIWLWSASSYLLAPLLAAVVLAVGGCVLWLALAPRHVTPIGPRLGIGLLLLTTATLVVSLATAIDGPEPATTTTTTRAGAVPLGHEGVGVALVDGDPCFSGSDWKESSVVIDGQRYDRGGFAVGGACRADGEPTLSTLTYALSKRFSRFTAHVGILDGAPPVPPIRVEVATDNGEQPLARRTVRVGEPWHVDMPVAGVVQVTFRVYLPDALPRTPVLGIAGALGHP